MTLKKEWKEQGFIDEPVAEGTNLKKEIRRLCKEKDAIILAHYYTVGDIQDVADFVGDSLALARKAAETDAKVMVMCGVHFMAETCKLLSPDKLVLSPDLNAGCSLADSCSAADLKKWKEEHPGYMIVQYVNTTASTKALTDVVVTSGGTGINSVSGQHRCNSCIIPASVATIYLLFGFALAYFSISAVLPFTSARARTGPLHSR